jgi:hypothetical protein
VVAIVALYLIGKSRSGASVAIGAIVDWPIAWEATSTIVLAMLLSGVVSFMLLWRAGARIASLVIRADYRALGVATVGFVAALSVLTTGIWGGVVLVAATALGLIPHFTGVRKAQAMGFFLVPTMLFFSGRQADVVDALHLQAVLAPDYLFTLGQVGLVVALSLGAAACAWVVWRVLKWWPLPRRIAAGLGAAVVLSAFARLGTVEVWMSRPGPDLAEPLLSVVVVGERALDGMTFAARTARGRLLTVRLQGVEGDPPAPSPHATAKLEALVRGSTLRLVIMGKDRSGAFVADAHSARASMSAICPTAAQDSGSISACLIEGGIASGVRGARGANPSASTGVDQGASETPLASVPHPAAVAPEQ